MTGQRSTASATDSLLRVGQNHWRAKLTNHEVELIRLFLLERRMLIALRRGQGVRPGVIDQELCSAGLSYKAIALKMEIAKSTVRDIESGRCRAYG